MQVSDLDPELEDLPALVLVPSGDLPPRPSFSWAEFDVLIRELFYTFRLSAESVEALAEASRSPSPSLSSDTDEEEDFVDR